MAVIINAFYGIATTFAGKRNSITLCIKLYLRMITAVKPCSIILFSIYTYIVCTIISSKVYTISYLISVRAINSYTILMAHNINISTGIYIYVTAFTSRNIDTMGTVNISLSFN